MKGFKLGQPREDQDLIATWKMITSTIPRVSDHHRSQSPHEDDSQESNQLLWKVLLAHDLGTHEPNFLRPLDPKHCWVCTCALNGI